MIAPQRQKQSKNVKASVSKWSCHNEYSSNAINNNFFNLKTWSRCRGRLHRGQRRVRLSGADDNAEWDYLVRTTTLSETIWCGRQRWVRLSGAGDNTESHSAVDRAEVRQSVTLPGAIFQYMYNKTGFKIWFTKKVASEDAYSTYGHCCTRQYWISQKS